MPKTLRRRSCARPRRWRRAWRDGRGGVGIGSFRRLAEHVGDLGRFVSDVMAEHEDRALFRGEPSEGAIELVTIGDAEHVVRRPRRVHREHANLGEPASLTAGVRDADVREDAMDPGVESVRIAEIRQVSPGDHQRVLQGILGPIDFPKDPMGDREPSIATGSHQVDECRLVAIPRRLDELSVHPRTHPDVQWGRRPVVLVDPARQALEIRVRRATQLAVRRHRGALFSGDPARGRRYGVQ